MMCFDREHPLLTACGLLVVVAQRGVVFKRKTDPSTFTKYKTLEKTPNIVVLPCGAVPLSGARSEGQKRQ